MVASLLWLKPIDMKLMTAAFVLLILIAPRMASLGSWKVSGLTNRVPRFFTVKRWVLGFCVTALIVTVSLIIHRQFKSPHPVSSKMVRIGLLQVSDNPLLNITRDSFVEEMKKPGYE
jgi:putative ABC transport system permease protein